MASLPPLPRALIGLLFAAFGLLAFFASVNMGPLSTVEIPGPPWLGAAVGSVFLAGGFALLLGDASAAASALAGLLIIVGLAVIANGLAFGLGERVCAATLSPEADNGGRGCRIGFGYGALVIDAFLLAVMARLVQKAAGGPPHLAVLPRAAKGVLMVVLSPLLLLLFLWTLTRAMVKRVKG